MDPQWAGESNVEVRQLEGLMDSDIESFLTKHALRALVAQECAGENLLCRQGPPLGAAAETWPEGDGVPFVPILSILVAELPYRPPFLEGAAYWSLFIKRHCSETWVGDHTLVVRKYADIAPLRLLRVPPEIKSPPLPLRFREVIDYPCDEALLEILSDQPSLLRAYESRDDELRERFPCHDGIKLGGYPLLIQPTGFLKCLDPDFAIQIDISSYFHYQDSGIGYFQKDLSYACWETL